MTKSMPISPDVSPCHGHGERVFSYHHTVSFEETNVVGNVYFTRHLSWQGRCREMFIKAYAPSVQDELSQDLRLVTLRVACNYHSEVFALDEIVVEMRLVRRIGHRIFLGFAYWRGQGEQRELVAEGTQEVAAMRLTQTGLEPCDFPVEMAHALSLYQANKGQSCDL